MLWRLTILTGLCAAALTAQKRDHGTVAAPGSVQDSSQAAVTKPFQVGATLPATCTVGQAFFKTDAAPGQNLHLCTAADTWTQLQPGGGGSTGSSIREQSFPPVLNQTGTRYLTNGWSTPSTDGAARGGGGSAPHTFGYLAFADGTPLYAVLNTRLPEDWDGGPIQATVAWTRNSGSGTAVALVLEAACVPPGATYYVPSYGPAQTLTPPLPAADTVAITTWASLNLGSCSAGDLLAIRLSRNPNHASDNFTGEARVINFTLRFPVQ
jgi:hypothetical protein